MRPARWSRSFERLIIYLTSNGSTHQERIRSVSGVDWKVQFALFQNPGHIRLFFLLNWHLGRFNLKVAMSVCVCVVWPSFVKRWCPPKKCLSVNYFFVFVPLSTTGNRWYMIHYTWHMTCDIDNNLKKFCPCVFVFQPMLKQALVSIRWKINVKKMFWSIFSRSCLVVNFTYCVKVLTNLKFPKLQKTLYFKSIGPLSRCFLWVNLSVCLSICPCVIMSVCSLLRYCLNVFLPPLPEVECPIFLDIRNPWGKVMERRSLRLEHFCLEVV